MEKYVANYAVYAYDTLEILSSIACLQMYSLTMLHISNVSQPNLI